MAAPISFSLSLALHRAIHVCLLLLFLNACPLSLHALDVSSACPHLLTPSTLKDYKRPSSNTSLLVVIPWKVGFEQFVHFDPDSCFIDGFSVQIFLQALRHMQQPQGSQFSYQFVLYGDGTQTPSYDEMIDMVAKGEVDAVVADVTITRERMDKVGFTMPYMASSLVMVTPFRYGSAGTLWDFLTPFSIPLWLTLFASFVATGAALYLLENKNPDFSIAAPKKLPAPPPSPDPSSHGSPLLVRSVSAHATAAETSASASAFASASASPSNLSPPTGFSARTGDAYVSASDPPSLQRHGPLVPALTAEVSPSLSASSSTSTSTSRLSSQTSVSAQMNNTYIPPLDPSSLQRPGPPIYDEASHKRRILNAYWFTSLCVFAAQQESVRTHLGRFVTVIWLFVMLIFNSSYTASLASILSAQKRYPTIDSFQALLSDKNISVGYHAGSFMKDYMKKTHFEQNRLKTITSEWGYIQALRDGDLKPDGVGAVLDESPYVQIMLQSECFLTKGPADDALPSWGGFAFAFRKKSPLIEEFSKMIVAMEEDETIKRLQNGWGIGGAESDQCSSTEEASHLRLRSFGGLFSVLCGAYLFCIVWRYSTKAVQSNREICMNVSACAGAGCNICQALLLSRHICRVRDVSLERTDASLEHYQGTLEHNQG